MASRADIEFTYTSIDRIFRMSLGELADFSGARYDGDFTMTLEEAQAIDPSFDIVRWRSLSKAAEAIRFAIEELPPDLLIGAHQQALRTAAGFLSDSK